MSDDSPNEGKCPIKKNADRKIHADLMANLFSRLFFNGNGLGMKGGAVGTTVCP